MPIFRYCLLLPAFFMASCGQHSTTSTTSSTAGTAVGSEQAMPASDHFYKRYSGTVAGQPVVVQLHSFNGVISGSYQYNSKGQVIELNMDGEKTAGGITWFTENVSGEAEHGGEPDYWSVTMGDKEISGDWINGGHDKRYPIRLKEDYPAGSVRLWAGHMADSARLREGKAVPQAIASYNYLLPADAAQEFLTMQLSKILRAEASNSADLDAVLRARTNKYFAQYRQENALQPGEQDDTDILFTLNYESDESMDVIYNDNQWLVIENTVYEYTGGAHGYYSSSYTNLDMQEHQEWTITNMITDSAALRPMLNDAAIAYFKLKPGEGMEQRMLVDEVPPTDNVYLTATGLTFVYNPYEIASYADGRVSLFLPYKKLMPFLTESFKARMKLADRAGVAMLHILR